MPPEHDAGSSGLHPGSGQTGPVSGGASGGPASGGPASRLVPKGTQPGTAAHAEVESDAQGVGAGPPMHGSVSSQSQPVRTQLLRSDQLKHALGSPSQPSRESQKQ